MKVDPVKLMKGLLRMTRWAETQEADEELATACVWLTGKLLEEVAGLPPEMRVEIEREFRRKR